MLQCLSQACGRSSFSTLLASDESYFSAHNLVALCQRLPSSRRTRLSGLVKYCKRHWNPRGMGLRSPRSPPRALRDAPRCFQEHTASYPQLQDVSTTTIQAASQSMRFTVSAQLWCSASQCFHNAGISMKPLPQRQHVHGRGSYFSLIELLTGWATSGRSSGRIQLASVSIRLRSLRYVMTGA